MYLIPPGPNSANLSASFITLLAQDGIALKVTDAYGQGLGRSQKGNFAPRVGFAYQITPKFVARAGFGVFYNGFENRGYSPNLGQNYPFQFQFAFFRPDDNHPIVYTDSNGAPCSSSSAGPIGNVTLETGFSCTPLDPLLVNPNGLQLRGIQFDYATPYSMGGNFALQYALTSSLSVQAGYVTTLARHLEVGSGSNHVSQILPAGANADDFKPFKDFARDGSQVTTDGNSSYHGLQVTVEKTFAGGLNFLGTYTWSKTRSDAGDLLNIGSTSREDTALRPFQVSESTVTMVWLISIFGMSSTSAAVTNFLLVRAGASCPVHGALQASWLEAGALCGAPRSKVANRLTSLAPRPRPQEQIAVLSSPDKDRHPDCTM